MRVLFAIPALDSGGPDRVVFELIAALPRERFMPSLAVQQPGGRYFEQLPADVATHVVPGGRYPVRGFARLVDRLRPDLVFTTLRMNLTAGVAALLQRHRPPLIARQANAIAADFAILKRRSLVKHRLAERLVRFTLRRADALVAQSADMAEELRRLGAPGQIVATIGNPVDLAAIAAAAGARAPDPLPGAPALVSVGRLMPQKGYDLLVEAMPAILARHPEAALTILGEGPDRSALAARAAALGIADRIALPGHSDAVLATVASADLFVSASRYEGFSNAILEAVALGVPVAATACFGATREMIVDGVSGMIAPRAEPAAIADAVLRALAGPRADLTAAARAHVEAHYTHAAIVGAYAALFDRIMKTERR